jgi:hypothetical protein
LETYGRVEEVAHHGGQQHARAGRAAGVDHGAEVVAEDVVEDGCALGGHVIEDLAARAARLGQRRRIAAAAQQIHRRAHGAQAEQPVHDAHDGRAPGLRQLQREPALHEFVVAAVDQHDVRLHTSVFSSG